MDTYYEELQETIRRSQQEIELLNNQLNGKYSFKNGILYGASEEEKDSIRRDIASREEEIKTAQNIVSNYDKAKALAEIYEIILEKRERATAANDANEIHNSDLDQAVLNDRIQELGLSEDIIKRISDAQKELKKADEQESSQNLEDEEKRLREEYNKSVQEIKDVFDEELKHFSGGSFKTNEDIDNAYRYYTDKKREAENKRKELEKQLREVREKIASAQIEVLTPVSSDPSNITPSTQNQTLLFPNVRNQTFIFSREPYPADIFSGVQGPTSPAVTPTSGNNPGVTGTTPTPGNSAVTPTSGNTPGGTGTTPTPGNSAVTPISGNNPGGTGTTPTPGNSAVTPISGNNPGGTGTTPTPGNSAVTPTSGNTPGDTGLTPTPGNTAARGTGSTSTPGKSTTKRTKTTPEIKKGYRRIIQELTAGLKLEPKMGKRYEASNIKVAKSFRNELHSGNYLYNVVHVIPAIIKIPIQLIRKISSGILLKAKDKADIKELENRLEKLSETDLETLFNDYIGGNIVQEHLPTIFNTLLNKRLQKYVQEKINNINADIRKNYNDIFESAKQIDKANELINNPSISEAEKKRQQRKIKGLAKGKAKVIKSIIDNQAEVNRLYSSGMHGFSEDVRADSTGLSLVGKRFAKKNNLDNDLQEQLAIFEDAINKAIAEKNDQAALEAFVKMEMLYSDNTKIEKSILGNRSVGSKVYTPIQTESLDYSTDPFVRDLMATIATTTAVIGTVNAIKTNIETDRMVDEYNRTIATANKAGDEIVSKRDTFSKGMEAQSQQDVLNASNALERDALNRVNWRLHGSDYTKYRGLDDANHAWYNDFYEQTKAALEEVASKRANGNISAQQALEEISTINSKTQSTMSGIMSDCLKAAHEYNPTVIYDNHGIQSVMEYMVQNPQAIPEMNEAMTDVVKIGESLRGLSTEQIQSFQNLSGNLATTLLATASAGALAQSVSSNMQQNIRNNKYGNEITNMVSEYAESRRQENQQGSRTR